MGNQAGGQAGEIGMGACEEKACLAVCPDGRIGCCRSKGRQGGGFGSVCECLGGEQDSGCASVTVGRGG